MSKDVIFFLEQHFSKCFGGFKQKPKNLFIMYAVCYMLHILEHLIIINQRYRILSKHYLSAEEEKALSNPVESHLQDYTSMVAAALSFNRDDLLLDFIRKRGNAGKELGKSQK